MHLICDCATGENCPIRVCNACGLIQPIVEHLEVIKYCVQSIQGEVNSGDHERELYYLWSALNFGDREEEEDDEVCKEKDERAEKALNNALEHLLLY
tara:strand:+ start:318 stop:608 length:291 start_codon:yes stop_codon:yes gene_type:complete